jgi:hypothetical protein
MVAKSMRFEKNMVLTSFLELSGIQGREGGNWNVFLLCSSKTLGKERKKAFHPGSSHLSLLSESNNIIGLLPMV